LCTMAASRLCLSCNISIHPHLFISIYLVFWFNPTSDAEMWDTCCFTDWFYCIFRKPLILLYLAVWPETWPCLYIYSFDLVVGISWFIEFHVLLLLTTSCGREWTQMMMRMMCWY
jgi:hypothetical protein